MDNLKNVREMLRCLNCFNRFTVPQGTKQFKCPKCNVHYVIAWVSGHAKIAGEAKMATMESKSN